MSVNKARSLGQHIRDVFTLADYRPLLTDPDPSPEQRSKIAESCRFYFTVLLVYAIAWLFLSVREIVRNQGDDAILGYIGVASAVGMLFLARKYYLSMRTYQNP
jgi:hypothetical protein